MDSIANAAQKAPGRTSGVRLDFMSQNWVLITFGIFGAVFVGGIVAAAVGPEPTLDTVPTGGANVPFTSFCTNNVSNIRVPDPLPNCWNRALTIPLPTRFEAYPPFTFRPRPPQTSLYSVTGSRSSSSSRCL